MGIMSRNDFSGKTCPYDVPSNSFSRQPNHRDKCIIQLILGLVPDTNSPDADQLAKKPSDSLSQFIHKINVTKTLFDL